jgi:hypothetical protein
VALARVYNVDTNLGTGISLGTGGVSGTEYVLMYGVAGAGVEFNISAVRIGLYSLSSAAYPTNGSITFSLRPVSSTLSGILVGTGTAKIIGQSTTAAASSWIYSTANGSGTGTFATMTTAPLWVQTLPCTAGANWGEWFTPGFELNQAPSGTLALTSRLSNGTVSGVNVIPELVISE